MDIRIFAPEEMIETEITLPLSKSMANRAQILDALTPGAHASEGTDACDDTAVMHAALSGAPHGVVDIGAAGTAMRFLTAYYAALPGSDVILDGVERMRQRPIAPLVEALRQMGADIEYTGREGFPPLRIKGRRLRGGSYGIDASVSSQFISAILMVAPTFDGPLTLELKGDVSSLPYIKMTLEMMVRRGVDATMQYDEVTVQPGEYKPLAQSDIERDWSAASYWYSVAAISAGWITLPGLELPSLQGDSRISEIFEKIGVVTGEAETGAGIELSASPEVYSRLDEDLSDCPDVVQTLAVACCMVGVPFRFTGVASLRIKETDRLEALRKELLKFGAIVEIEGDGVLRWEGRRMPVREVPAIDTYGDHRMAMAFAPAAVFASGMVVRDAEVVSKSYPGFWQDMERAGFRLVDAAQPLETPEP